MECWALSIEDKVATVHSASNSRGLSAQSLGSGSSGSSSGNGQGVVGRGMIALVSSHVLALVVSVVDSREVSTIWREELARLRTRIRIRITLLGTVAFGEEVPIADRGKFWKAERTAGVGVDFEIAIISFSTPFTPLQFPSLHFASSVCQNCDCNT